ncbi:MAG: type II toxin-antitoxin system RelE family toxin [Christensenellaceae bacterium]|jgi:mRNA interferase RelE/StbE
MSEYNVEYSMKAGKYLHKLDRIQSKIIIAWIEKHLVGCENPRVYGKALKGGMSGLWRYRVGKYRIIANIEDDKLLILVLEVGHRKEIYK